MYIFQHYALPSNIRCVVSIFPIWASFLLLGKASLHQGDYIRIQIFRRTTKQRSTEIGNSKQEWDHIGHCSLLVGQTNWEVLYRNTRFLLVLKRVLSSLAATIKAHRPDISQHITSVVNSPPISKEPPPEFFDKQINTIEDIGEPTNACFFTNSQIDPTDWYSMLPLSISLYWSYGALLRWVFEKYDGIRGFWNPLKKAMFSRTGKRFDLPQEVIDDMPSDLFLDGELW